MSQESTVKLLDYINKVAREPMIVNGQPFGAPPVKEIFINESFFWKDGCQMCGKCCPNETTVWTHTRIHEVSMSTEEDFTRWGLDREVLHEISSRIQTVIVNVNSKDVPFFVSPADKDPQRVEWEDRKEQPRCHWLFEKDGTYRCRIHPVRSVTCGMPHCRFFHNTHTHKTTIGLSQFGRNWALKCPVEFSPYIDEESVRSRMLWLSRLQDAADDCGVRTWLPEILDGLQTLHPFALPKRKKLF